MILITYLKDYRIQTEFTRFKIDGEVVNIGFSFLYYNIHKLAEVDDVYKWNDKKIHKKYNFKIEDKK